MNDVPKLNLRPFLINGQRLWTGSLRPNSAVCSRYRIRYLLLDVVDLVGGDVDDVSIPIRCAEHEWPGVSAARAFLGLLVDQTTAKKEETVCLVGVIFYEPPKLRVADEVREDEKGSRPPQERSVPRPASSLPLSRYKKYPP